MKIFLEFIRKIAYDRRSDRIGPDLPFSHWKLFFPSSMKKLCQKKFESFGENSAFRPGAFAITCSKISIGKNNIIRPGTMLFADPRKEYEEGKILIEDDVLIGSNVHIYVSNHRFDDKKSPIIQQGHYPPKNVTLKRGCWIGAGSIILPGITIGENSVIGAGSVVTKEVGAKQIAAGNPARIIKSLSEKD